jgi:hypothetical protein
MKQRTTIVLGVIALALSGAVWYSVAYLPTSTELEDRGDKVFPGFDRDRVDRIVLGQGDDRIELEREAAESPDADLPGTVGRWRLRHPREIEADPEAVDSLLSALDWLEKRRTLTESGAAKQARFGLDHPQRRVEFRLRGRDVVVLIGGEAPGEALYLAVEGRDDTVHVVDQEFLEQVSKEVGELRDRRLTSVRVRDVQAVRVTGRFHARRGGPHRWDLVTPDEMRADAGAIEDVIRNIEGLRAARYVADDVQDADLRRYGLDAPAREVTLRLEGRAEPVVLRFGGACQDHADEVYATTMGSGTVACVEAEVATEQLGVDPRSLRDMGTTRLREDQLDAVTVTRGDLSLTLRRSGSRWLLPAPGETGAAGADAGSSDADAPTADAESVEAMIDALRDMRATEVTTDLGALASDEPRADLVIRLDPDDDELEEEVLSFARVGDRLVLRRGAERLGLVMSGELPQEISPDPLRFRDRRLLDETASDATELEVTAGPTRQVLRKSDATWDLTSPVHFRADQVVVRDVVRSLSSLEAVRFAAASPAAEHGLARPFLRVRIHYERGDEEADAGGPAPHDRVLSIGSETEGGRFARLDGNDETVFVISGELVTDLAGPLIDRDLFAAEEDRIDRLTVGLEGSRRVLARRDEGWTDDGRAASGGEVDRILARLATARAAEVLGFGRPQAAMGLDEPRLRVTVHLSEHEEGSPEELVILVGSEYRDGDERRVYARRADVDATFGLPLRVVEPLLPGVASEPPDAGPDEANDADGPAE